MGVIFFFLFFSRKTSCNIELDNDNGFRLGLHSRWDERSRRAFTLCPLEAGRGLERSKRGDQPREITVTAVDGRFVPIAFRQLFHSMGNESTAEREPPRERVNFVTPRRRRRRRRNLHSKDVLLSDRSKRR